MVHMQRWTLIGVLLLSLSLVGCQGTVNTGVAASPALLGESAPLTITATVAPTSTPTPVPSPTATPTSTSTPTPFVCTNQRGQTLNAAFISTAMGGEEIRYLVHLPACYDAYPDRAFPVLYLLHGWPLNEYHWVSLGVTEIVDEWVSQGLIGPLILVMPGVVNPDGLYVYSSGGSDSFEGMLVEELRPAIEHAYRTIRQPTGRAIGGISRGGVWSLEIGLRHPDLFGIVGGHSPALSVNRPFPAYDPFVLAEEGAPNQRVYLDAGDLDWARGGAMQLQEALLAKGADVTYQVHEGGHVDELWQLGLPDYLNFYTSTWPDSFDALPQYVENPEELWLEAPSDRS